jgi:dTDP-4-amino-4,6-dideoxygalactose transaminase
MVTREPAQTARSTIRMAKPYNAQAIEERVISILRSGRLVQGENVEQFEDALTKYIGCKHVIAVNSGTAALASAMMSLLDKVNKKDEVITTPLSFAATANAIIHSGLNPVFADADPETFNIDISSAKEKVSEKTLAIEPVDVYGLPADYDNLRRVGKGLSIVEDAAEAIGAKYRGRRVGSFSTVTCFSTYATKNLHTAEGGFITTEDDNLARKMQLIRNQGQVSKYNQTMLGYNFRMTEICAAMGLEQLPLLERLNTKRRENSILLREELRTLRGIGYQRVDDPEEHSWYMCAFTLNEREAGKKRDKLLLQLKERGIEADVAWPTPIHLQPYYRETFGYKEGDFPNAEKICKEVFQLPIQPSLSHEDLARIVSSMKEILSH